MTRSHLAAGCCACMLATGAFGGQIVVNNDEWPLSDGGFTTAGGTNAATYAKNAAAFLTGGSGSILIYSSSFGLTGTSLQNTLTGPGYTVTEDGTGATPFTLAALSAYKAVFLAGNPFSENNAILTQYVNAGGGVYIGAGTGGCCFATPAAEAAQWNGFLNGFGLTYTGAYNGVSGNLAANSASPVLAGVTQLYYVNGNDVGVNGVSPLAQVISSSGQHGLIGVFAGPSVAIPEQSTFGLVGFGIVATGWRQRKRLSRS